MGCVDAYEAEQKASDHFRLDERQRQLHPSTLIASEIANAYFLEIADRRSRFPRWLQPWLSGTKRETLSDVFGSEDGDGRDPHTGLEVTR